MSKTTKAQFKLFKEESRRWIERFQLGDWEVYFEHKDSDDYIASCSFDTESCVATIRLSQDWGSNPLDLYEIKKSAFHEVMELFLANYYTIATSRQYSLYHHNKTAHQLIRTLENAIFDREYTGKR